MATTFCMANTVTIRCWEALVTIGCAVTPAMTFSLVARSDVVVEWVDSI